MCAFHLATSGSITCHLRKKQTMPGHMIPLVFHCWITKARQDGSTTRSQSHNTAWGTSTCFEKRTVQKESAISCSLPTGWSLIWKRTLQDYGFGITISIGNTVLS